MVVYLETGYNLHMDKWLYTKKISSLVKILCALCMFFIVLFCFSSCGWSNLAEYKYAAKAEIESYIQELEPNNYSSESWELILRYVEDGKSAIDTAKSDADVDSIVAAIKNEVGSVSEGKIINYNAIMYGNPYKVRKWINDDFYENNLTFGAWSIVLEKYIDDEDYPRFRNLIITEQEAFDTVFKEFPSEIDFKKEMIVMNGITTASGSELLIVNVTLNGQTLCIKYGYPVSDEPNASMPLTKWVVVKLDKLNITTVELVS